MLLSELLAFVFRTVLVKSRETDSDYINASVVQLSENKTYIVTQAPMPGTVNDMWRLVWDYEVNSVVTLMDSTENKSEIPRYWPLHGRSHTYRSITVQVRKLLQFTTKQRFAQRRIMCTVDRRRHKSVDKWFGFRLSTLSFSLT